MANGRKATWGAALARKGFVAVLLATLGAGLALAWLLPRFFAWLALRPGAIPPDPVLANLGPYDLSVPIFVVLYGALAAMVVVLARRPFRLLHGLLAYVGLVALRMVCMALFTLEPPPGMVPLIDPLTQGFYPGEQPFAKDLFFSGHTATLMLLALLAPKGAWRLAVAAAAAFVGMGVLLQHVHWSIDVLAAVPAAWLCHAVAGGLLNRWGLRP